MRSCFACPVSGSLDIVQLEVGLLENFCEVIGCPVTGEAALVDPAFEVDRLLREASSRNWKITTILLTHTHDDHIAGLDEAAAATAAVVRCHPVEVETARRQAPRVQAVTDGEWIPLGQGRVQAIHTPGHTPGCVCWFAPDPGAVITGDVLFVGSCGGVGYPDSDPHAMVDSLQRKLAVLPESTVVYPGHNYGRTPTSRLAWELANNPAFLRDTVASFCAWKGTPVPGSANS
ncbi:MAG: MBL fold metallo-hydrolase [Myxococcales bacterium FL481]|nr:MAG: MBL fold metallo-hydrolase [Myxococcales bacterium FL481]